MLVAGERLVDGAPLARGERVAYEIGAEEAHIGGVRVDHDARRECRGLRGPFDIVGEVAGLSGSDPGIVILMLEVETDAPRYDQAADAAGAHMARAALPYGGDHLRGRIGRKIVADPRIRDYEVGEEGMARGKRPCLETDGECAAHEARVVYPIEVVAPVWHMTALACHPFAREAALAPFTIDVFKKGAVQARPVTMELMTAYAKSAAREVPAWGKATVHEAPGGQIWFEGWAEALVVAHMAVGAGDALAREGRKRMTFQGRLDLAPLTKRWRMTGQTAAHERPMAKAGLCELPDDPRSHGQGMAALAPLPVLADMALATGACRKRSLEGRPMGRRGAPDRHRPMPIVAQKGRGRPSPGRYRGVQYEQREPPPDGEPRKARA